MAPRPVAFGAALALGAASFMLWPGAVIALFWGGGLFVGVTFTGTVGITIPSAL